MYDGIYVVRHLLKRVHPMSDGQTPDWAWTANKARAIRGLRDAIANAYSSNRIQTFVPNGE